MRKIFFLIFIISFNCFSQKIGKLDFSISEIDNLCKEESCLIIQDLGNIIKAEKITKRNTEKEIKTIGSGYTVIKTHFYSSDYLNYEKLTLNEKKRYDERKYCKLIRADYQEIINYEDGSNMKVNAEFYYNRDELFYIMYKVLDFDNNIENAKYYNLFVFEIEKELNENQDLKKWIINQNEAIVKICKDK